MSWRIVGKYQIDGITDDGVIVIGGLEYHQATAIVERHNHDLLVLSRTVIKDLEGVIKSLPMYKKWE